ncbi:hypothetical protein FIV42_01295 [Persicimonas caeni]|uniref:HTH luxR-type domain-containing protein n=1 Tax=Persicimonas caeni TaxID=2292766 RepID=A0A4Y6PM91_PERCE|nr:helix-turn-helix transcriptional regulator [Persicimonas caeni]QDG49418.1 hypothetical protein FIV42_01295 [Persicimonas caeni]QED30639.1 hypothetical protein FRD00_01290 [Persicimonas caeni]
MSNVVRAAHAAYILEGNEEEWLENLTGVMAPLLDRGRGFVGFRWRNMPSGGVRADNFALVGGRPGDHEMLHSLHANLDRTRASLAYRAPYTFRSLSEIATEHPTLVELGEDRDMQQIAHARELLDFEMLRVDDADGQGWMFSVLRKDFCTIPARRRDVWERVGAHIAAGARLRMKLSKPDLDGAAAVYDGAAKTLNINEPSLQRKDRRHRLMELIEARQHAEDIAGNSPLEALDLWGGLVDGQWSLLDVVDSDGRTYTVLRENPLRVRSSVSLTERERQVAWLVGRGHHVKLVAYELGLSASTIRSQLRSALRKLNLDDRSSLCRLVANITAPDTVTSLDGLGVLALAEAPVHIPESLTDAEREVARLLYEGLSNREIAEHRGTATRTVANQLASIYAKLGVASRDDLVQHLAGGPAHEPA